MAELAGKPSTESARVFVRRSSGLVREIGAGDALAGNILLVNLVAAAVIVSTLPFTFPGANMPLAILLSLIPALAVGTVYVLFNIAMPRSGGDYVYISRALHPSIGFAANFSFVAWNIIFGGLLGNWIATVYLSGFFASIGLNDVATAVSKPLAAFLIGSVSVLLTAVIVVSGTRLALRLMNLFFYVGMAGLLATVGLIAFTSHQAFVDAVNNSASYSKIIDAAHTAGYVSPGDWNQVVPTIESVALVSLTTLFVMFSSYAGGELRNVRRSVPIAIYGSMLIGGLVFFAMAAAAVHSWSNEFIAASNYLNATDPSKYPLSAPPSFNYFAVLPHPGATWAIIANGSFILLVFGNLIFGFITLSRCLFAWSFDRLLPHAITSVNDRTHTPVVAIATIAIATLVMIALYTIYGSVAFLGGATMGLISTFIVAGIAAVAFPYLRRTLYRSSPARPDFLGVPVLVIAGVATVILLGAMVWAFLTNATFGANGGQGLVFFAGLWVVGFVIFYAVKLLRQRQGVDIDVAFAELPPE